MLTVSIFSASTMVAAFSAVANSATPRASQLLIEDSTVQNTLAVFIGAFLLRRGRRWWGCTSTSMGGRAGGWCCSVSRC